MLLSGRGSVPVGQARSGVVWGSARTTHGVSMPYALIMAARRRPRSRHTPPTLIHGAHGGHGGHGARRGAGAHPRGVFAVGHVSDMVRGLDRPVVLDPLGALG